MTVVSDLSIVFLAINLEGKIIIDYYDGTTFEGLAKDGVFHGICRYVIELLFFLDIFYDFLD